MMRPAAQTDPQSLLSGDAPPLIISREIQCDVGHRIPKHGGPCRHVHGHRYRIVVRASGPVNPRPEDSEHGMVADFGFLKQIMMQEIHDVVDHGFLVWKDDEPMRSFLEAHGFHLLVMDGPPTAENFAMWCFERMESACQRLGKQVKIQSVVIWETPNCSAEYTKGAQ